MKSFVPDFELATPPSLTEALRLLTLGAQPFAGGTDLMVQFAAGTLSHRLFVNLSPLAELHGIEDTPGYLQIGALTTYSELIANAPIRENFPMLAAAARQSGAVAIQNRGTLGGNIANASPAADSCPVLLAYDAELLLLSAHSRRTVPYQHFHTGYKQSVLQPGELIVAIRLAHRTGAWHDCFQKVAPRQAQAIAKVNMAAAARIENGKIQDIRIAFGSVAPTPIRCPQTEREILDGRPFTLSELHPIDDLRSTAAYRLQVARNLLTHFLLTAQSTPAPSATPTPVPPTSQPPHQ